MQRAELNRNDGSPLYIQIRELYRERILSGELGYGAKLESEMEIQKRFNVSRITARQAIADLEKEGLVSRGRGRGTFVTWQPHGNGPMIESFTRHVRERGQRPGTSHFEIEKVQADQDLLNIFHMVSAKPIYCFRRTRTVDGVRICCMYHYFPSDLDFPTDVQEYDESVYEKLAETAGFHPAQANEEYSAIIPDREVARELNIQRNIPVLCRKRLCYDRRGKVIEYSVSYYRGDLYSHELHIVEEEER